jgi:hypothetical protein
MAQFNRSKKNSFLLLIASTAIAIILLFLTPGCSTEKNKFLNRSYHNTTARYNGYFNAKENIKESLIDFHIK